MEVAARIAVLTLAETFTIARESQDVAEVVEVEVRHGELTGFGEAAPIARYDQTAASSLAWLETVELGDDPWALDEIASEAAAGRSRGAGCARRGAARSAGEARRRAGLQAARPAARRAPDLVDGLARRSRRHGAAGGGGGAAGLPPAQAEARRPRRARSRARPGGQGRDDVAAPGRRERVLDARRGARAAAADADRLLRAAASRRRRRRPRVEAPLARSDLRGRGLPYARRRRALRRTGARDQPQAREVGGDSGGRANGATRRARSGSA